MTSSYDNWQKFMRSRRGLWTIDPIHNGVDRDLIAFCSNRSDPSRGVYVSVAGPTIRAGSFDGALPHIGDACFNPQWGYTLLDGSRPSKYGADKPSESALKIVFERLGLRFLIQAAAMEAI